ncbi:hypothetical protein XA68_12650 [Ophiocordyceps unilateralis]|uniref:Uncharacterized protein n=1 Tax=Ophiocordyceps unilateralis TaxID=268505 RepID=A0A2A9PCT3_OPHUN|nr:hypothetical protein XA68_12650 [Ophiocordyceps unilateralis]
MPDPPALTLFPTPSFSRPLPGRLRRRDGPSSSSSPVGEGSDGAIDRRDDVTASLPESAFFPPPPEPQPFRSMFPIYDPNLPLESQPYAPATHVPRSAVSPTPPRPPPDSAPVGSTRRPPPGVMSEPGTDCQLRGLWKAANGWRAVESEGRVYCLAMSRPRDAPVYTFSSASNRPFYKLRLDPTSASANVSLRRYDPSKPFRTAKASDSKGWHEALSTTLEVESRDGLVASLMPSAAARMALDRPDDGVAVAAAEKERARLVWDEDSAAHFLVHPTLAHPFHVAVERSPAYSRTHYTLEHRECPGFLARLTRDGTGGGWLELDTAVAAKTGAYYMVDVAVAALAIVAANDDRNSSLPAETFEPPPPLAPPMPPPPPPAVLAGGGSSRSPSRFSRLGLRRKDRNRERKRDEFELDVESHDGSLRKGISQEEEKKKLPLVVRAMAKVTKALGKCVLCIIKVLIKLVAAIFRLAYKCVR